MSAISFQSENAGDNALRDVTLGIAADGQTWIRLVQERVDRGDWRIRHTWLDNAPEGRDVHWSSLWGWWLELGGRIRMLCTDEDFGTAVAGAAIWANFPLWMAVMVVGGVWTARRWGWAAGVVLVLAMVGNRGFYTGLYPAYPDHHGAAAVLALGMIAGVWTRLWTGGETCRHTAWVSALCGATGLALSASSLVLPIALTGAGGIVAAWAGRKSRSFSEAGTLAAWWASWGRMGAAFSSALYLLEYAPSDFSWRLEVNHPVFALAWWGGAEVIAWFIRRLAGARSTVAHDIGAILGAAGVFAPLAVVWVTGGEAFSPAGEFIVGVHRHIDEFKPLWTQPVRTLALFFAPLLLPMAVFPWAWRELDARERGCVSGLVVVTLGLGLLTLLQLRWWPTAAAAQITLAALATVVVSRGGVSRALRLAWVAMLAVIVVPGPWLLARERMLVERRSDVQTSEAMQLLHRDLAATLRADSDHKDVVLLAHPNASVAVGYYGDFKSVGTLYWENGDGLLAAAEAFSTEEDAVAERIIRSRGVTHVAVVTPGDFTAEYADALGLPPGRVAERFGRRVLAGRNVPTWLRAIPYRVPREFERLQVRVALYAVDWEIGVADSRWALGMACLMAGEEGNGRAALRESAEAGRWQAALILAWRMATAADPGWRDGEGAVAWAESAVGRLPEAAAHRRVLAAAYAAAGRWSDAQATMLFAIDQAEQAGDVRLVAELERDFAHYLDRRALVD